MKEKIRLIIRQLLLSLSMIVGVVGFYHMTADASDMKVHFIDVGQGLAILVQTEDENLLYDGGDKEGVEDLIEYLKTHDVKTINYMISSHYHPDHITGLIECLKEFDVEKVLASNYKPYTNEYYRFMEEVTSKGLTVEYPKVGDEIMLGDVQIQIIGPATIDSEKENNNSLALKIVNGGNVFIFPGDAEVLEEEAMYVSGRNLKCDVLAISHHGSDTSTTDDFLECTAPKSVVISCGENNQYGHPRSKTMEKLKTLNIDMYRTDKQKTIIATSDGTQITWNKPPCQDYSAGVKPDKREKETSSEVVTEEQSEKLSEDNQ